MIMQEKITSVLEIKMILIMLHINHNLKINTQIIMSKENKKLLVLKMLELTILYLAMINKVHTKLIIKINTIKKIHKIKE